MQTKSFKPFAVFSAVILFFSAFFIPVALADETAGNIEVTGIHFTDKTHEVYAGNTLQVDWKDSSPRAGNYFTVSMDNTLVWGSELTYPMTATDGTIIGQCVSTRVVLTCTENTNAEKYDILTGYVRQRATFRPESVNTDKGTVIVNGKAYSIDYPGTITFEREKISPGTYKVGWADSKSADGTILYGWWVYSDFGTTRTVVDETADVDFIQCATKDDNTWSDSGVYRPEFTKNGSSVTWNVKNESDTCRVKYFSYSKDTSVTNTASVNGTVVSVIAKFTQSGEGSVEGTENPKPSEPEKPTTPKTENPKPVVKTETKSKPKQLAQTGVEWVFIALVAIFFGGIGIGCWIISKAKK